MGKTIYKLFMMKPNEAWYQLSSEQQEDYLKKSQESFENVGGKSLVMADCSWSSEEWMFFGVEEYPDLEAEQKHVEFMMEQNMFRYSDSKSILGTLFELF